MVKISRTDALNYANALIQHITIDREMNAQERIDDYNDKKILEWSFFGFVIRKHKEITVDNYHELLNDNSTEKFLIDLELNIMYKNQYDHVIMFINELNENTEEEYIEIDDNDILDSLDTGKTWYDLTHD